MPPIAGVVPALLLLGILLPVSGCGPGRPGSSAPPALPTGVRADVRERAYPVRGLTRQEIGRSLAENRISAEGGLYTGVHNWRITWRYRYGPASSTCRIRSLDVRLVSETVLPRWEDRDRADRAVVADWDRFIGLLRTHENQHRNIAYRAARDVHRSLRRVTSPDCGSMPARADELARRILRTYQDRNRAYDEETRHGSTEGLRWPPAAAGDAAPARRTGSEPTG